MAFAKGHAKLGGRRRGTPNTHTAALKDAIFAAFDAVGGHNYLVTIAREDPRTFCSLLGRVLPSELRAEIAGGVSNELVIVDYSKRDRTVVAVPAAKGSEASACDARYGA